MSAKISRRDFLKLAGAGAITTAVLTGCGPASRYVVRRPYTDMPEYNQTGVSTYYATTCRECPAGCGLIVRTMEGRALKVEGNPNHPVSRGKVCSRGLTSVQALYNPDRIQGPRKQARGGGSPKDFSWDEAIKLVGDALKADPKGIAFLFGLAPDHLYDLAAELTSAIGASQPLRYGAHAIFDGFQTLVKASQAVYGKPALPYFDLANATVVLNFGANFAQSWLSPVAYGRMYGAFRSGDNGARGYLITFEPRMSPAGGISDEWIPIQPGAEGILAAAIGKLVAQMRGVDAPEAFKNVDVAAAEKLTGLPAPRLEEIAKRFAGAARPLALAGGSAAAHVGGLEASEAVLLLNDLVGNTGKPGGVYLSQAELGQPAVSSLAEISALIQKMNAGEIKTLFIHGTNPVFELPGGLNFAAALAKVPQVISFASFPDETALQSDIILPDHTGLEAFGYQTTLAGADRLTLSSAQPVVTPLRNTRATVDVLLAAVQNIGGDLATKLDYADEVDFIQKKLIPYLENTNGIFTAPEILSFWTQWLQYGGWWLKAPGLSAGAPPADAVKKLSIPAPAAAADEKQLHLVVYLGLLGDGSSVNRPWMQETPDPMTTVMWNSWIEMNPETAAKLGIKDDDIVKIRSSAGEIEASVYKYPAIRPDTIAIQFGQGHTAFGRFAEKRGVNPASLLPVITNQANDLAAGDVLVTVTPTGRKRALSRLESREGVYGSKE
jgi:anaerobic selenocysteine-containing dehydrogenase